jgi:hypothetical protein
MEHASQVLMDAGDGMVADGVVCEGRAATADGRNWRVNVQTLRRDGRSEGVRIVAVDNGAMSISVLPTRGMGIWQVLRHHSPSSYQAGERGAARLGWRSPVRGPVHPAFVPVFDPSGLGWLEGFDELMCRCGLESNGAPDFEANGKLLYPLHGRIANLPAHRVELDVDENAGRISLRGVVEETRFHFQSLRLTTMLTTTIGSNEFTWSDEVENIGGRDATMQMLYHFNIGQPLLQPGARITAPLARVAPWTQVAAREGIENWNTMPPPRPGSAEQGYLLDLIADEAGETRVLVSGLTDGEAISLRYSKRSLPCFTVWRNTPAEADGYVLGIEPGTNYPNPRTFEQQHGRVVKLKPGQTWNARVTATWHGDAQSIAQEDAAIRAIQGNRHSELNANPQTEWSANP